MSEDLSRFTLDNVFSVSGTTVLITGGGTGIGRSLTSAFAANGAKVIIVGRRAEVLQATCDAIGRETAWVQGDVSTKAGVEAVMQQVEQKTSVVDTVINCAGISIPFRKPNDKHEDPDAVYQSMSSVEDSDWSITYDVNINGPYFVTIRAVPLLRRSDNPNVIIISSVAGLANQRGNGSFTYGVSKAGAVHLSSMLAGRLHPMKIRVNCICPGIFPSEMTTQKAADGSLLLGRMGSKAVLRSTLGRPGKPEEIAAPALMLASKGGMYMNDVTLNVDGGRWLVMKGIYDGIHLHPDSYIDDDD